MHTKFEFDFETSATPDQVIEPMIDFTPNRPNRWPASSEQAFEVYHLGDTGAWPARLNRTPGQIGAADGQCGRGDGHRAGGG